MPNGFWYASGPRRAAEGIPASAFSKGDILALNSSSSLSRLNPYAATTGTQYAIADADSIDSIRNKVPVTVIMPDTYFWSATTSGVTLITGENSGVSFVAAAPGRYWLDESTATAIFTVVEGTDRIDQSIQSKVIGQFRYAAGELDLS